MCDLKACIPSNKHDLAAVQRAADLGFPQINSILSELFEWTEDISWPVARELSSLLSQGGREIIPFIQLVLKGNDGCWKCSVLLSIVKNLNDENWRLIHPELARLSKSTDINDIEEDIPDFAAELIQERSVFKG